MYPFLPVTCTYILTLPNPGLPISSTPISSLRIPGSSGWYYNEILIVGDMIEWDILPLQLNPLLWVQDSWHAVPVRNPQQQSWEKAPSEISSRLLFGKPALRNWLLLTTARNDRWPTNPATRVWWFLVPSRHCREEETVYQITTFIYWLSGGFMWISVWQSLRLSVLSLSSAYMLLFTVPELHLYRGSGDRQR